MKRRLLLCGILAALSIADAPAWAQRVARDAVPPTAAARRQRLEQQVTQRLAQVVRRELGLDDSGMRRLQQTNQRFERRRPPEGWRVRSPRDAPTRLLPVRRRWSRKVSGL